ncbi:response regulator [Ureibacillus acetophenoni]|uniref:response regulator n=1 Tax=Ureibacillus acetophenoni TaxID=614649 RepID=UPI000BE2592C|nr:response regulator [Ureibacillus acetophenoni]
MKELLIVDDHQGIRLLLKEVFNKEGYLVHLATSGAEAIRLVEKYNLHCVLLDMKIPDMNGLEIIKRIKNINCDLPIIMMSAFSEQTLIEKALEQGASCFFTKPFNIHDLITTVKNKVYIDKNQNEQ